MEQSNITVIQPKKKYSGAIRTGIYCRVSSAKKAQLESLNAQISSLTTYIAYLPTHILLDTYIDIASGATLSGRPGFQRLLEDCSSGRIQHVMSKSTSRFGRDTVIVLEAIRQLSQSNVTVFFQAEGITSADPDFQVQVAAYAAFAQMENIERSENIKWGIKARAESGKSKIYNKICYGYCHDIEGNLIINKEQADNVRLIFRYYLDGYSILGIIKKLAVSHIKSPSGKDTWSKRSVEILLNNIKYTGDAIIKTDIGTHIFSDHHPAIISRDVFEAVQTQQKSRSNMIISSDGRTIRKNTKYSGIKVTRETADVYQILSDAGFDDIIPSD